MLRCIEAQLIFHTKVIGMSMTCRKEYTVCHVEVHRDDINVIIGNTQCEIILSKKYLRINCTPRNYTVVEISRYPTGLNGVVARSSTIHVATLLSKSIISKILHVPVYAIRKLSVDIRRYPYVSSSYIEICRKIGIVFTIHDCIILKLMRKLEYNKYLIHYLLMLLGYNYDVEYAILGRKILSRFQVTDKMLQD